MKYMGSKSRFAKEIYQTICNLSQKFNGWVEPFAGGMNMISNVPQEVGVRYANDSNKYLIAMFQALSNGWEPPKFVTKDFYESCKRLEQPDYVIGYVGFNCSYSGKWFGGYAGKITTKEGTVRDYQDEAWRNIKKQIQNLNGVVYTNLNYQDVVIPFGAVVYCDPPYAGTTGYKDTFDHHEFWEWVRKLAKTNTVFVSEYTAPDDFECVWEKSTKSSLSANGVSGGNKNSVEKLFRLKNALQ